MDLATGIGLVAGIGTLVGVIMLDGGNFGTYFDSKGFVLVICGTVASTMISFPPRHHDPGPADRCALRLPDEIGNPRVT